MSDKASKKLLLEKLAINELIILLNEFKKELMNLRFQRASADAFSGTDRFRKVRRNVARVKTELRKRSAAQGQTVKTA